MNRDKGMARSAVLPLDNPRFFLPRRNRLAERGESGAKDFILRNFRGRTV